MRKQVMRIILCLIILHISCQLIEQRIYGYIGVAGLCISMLFICVIYFSIVYDKVGNRQ